MSILTHGRAADIPKFCPRLFRELACLDERWPERAGGIAGVLPREYNCENRLLDYSGWLPHLVGISAVETGTNEGYRVAKAVGKNFRRSSAQFYRAQLGA